MLAGSLLSFFPFFFYAVGFTKRKVPGRVCAGAAAAALKEEFLAVRISGDWSVMQANDSVGTRMFLFLFYVLCCLCFVEHYCALKLFSKPFRPPFPVSPDLSLLLVKRPAV